MANIFVYLIDLPEGINEMVASGIDSFTVYIDRKLSNEKRLEAYNHALKHINMGHFDIDCDLDVNEMECEAHYGKA